MGMLIRHQRHGRNRLQQQRQATSGFSLLEMVIVVAIALIISGFAIINTQGAVKDARLNGAYDTAFMQLRLARQRSIEERTRYIVTFGTPGIAGAATPFGAPTAKSIQVYSWTGAGAPSTAVQISTINLPFDIAFQAQTGLPTGAATVPDGFGNGSTAIDFDQGIPPGGGNLVMFTPDGSAHDTAGNYNSGVLYVARNTDVSSTRAITLFGTSGRIRGWRLVQVGGVATWKQQ
jgi:prepilin-type N-terminal cleavage/methylation domain-containing protein